VKNVVITGSKGMLGYSLKKQLKGKVAIIEVDLPEYDLTDKECVTKIFSKNQVDFVYHLAAYTNVDLCETNQDDAFRVNEIAVTYLAQVTSEKNIPLLVISTDYVFDGKKGETYSELDIPNPLSIYGKSKLAGEQAASLNPNYFVVRTAWLYGPNGKNFVKTMLDLSKDRDLLSIVSDQYGTPTYTVDLAKALELFLTSSAYGIYHVVNSGETTWCDFAKEILSEEKVSPISSDEYLEMMKGKIVAPRPSYSVLCTDKFKKEFDHTLSSWQDGLRRYISEYLS